MTARYSVLLPVCNGAAYLEEAIRSVLDQTSTDFELLIADDRSEDDSVAIIERFSDPRIRFFKNPVRRGLFANLNFLLEKSKGQFLRVLCQDDRLYPDALKREMEFFTQHPEVGMLLAKSKTINEAGDVIREATLRDLPDVISTELAMQHYFYHGCLPGNLTGAAFTRQTLQAIGPFDPAFRVSGDYEFWVRACEKFPMGFLHQHIVAIRFHANQLSRRRSSGILFVRENRLIRKRVWRRLPSEVRRKAKRYEKIRHGAMEFHWALRSFLSGHPSDLWNFIRAVGPAEALWAFFYWGCTVNNRLFYPQATWVVR